MSTNKSTEEAVAQMPNQRTMVRRIQRCCAYPQPIEHFRFDCSQ